MSPSIYWKQKEKAMIRTYQSISDCLCRRFSNLLPLVVQRDFALVTCTSEKGRWREHQPSNSVRGYFNSALITLKKNAIPAPLVVSVRSKKKSSREADDTDDSDDEFAGEEVEEDFSEYPKGYRVLNTNIGTLRVDSVLSTGLAMSRKKVEDQFLSSNLRKNEEKVLKKSARVGEGDRLDLILSKNDDTGVLIVKRVILHKIYHEKTTTDKFKVKLVAWRQGITVDNYDNKWTKSKDKDS